MWTSPGYPAPMGDPGELVSPPSWAAFGPFKRGQKFSSVAVFSGSEILNLQKTPRVGDDQPSFHSL